MNGKSISGVNYLLITPCKNEGKNLPSLISSVEAQTIRPLVWYILDDGSTDDTQNILKTYQKKCSWIKVLRFEEHRRDLGLHLAKVMSIGFNYAIDYCKQMKLEYNYLGNLDGDLILPPTFYESLMKEFKNDSKLGIASGGTKNIISNRIVYKRGPVNEPSGGHMLIRRECFENIGGFPISYSSDSVCKAKARLRGWETKRFEDNIATEIRAESGAEGLWKGAIQLGKSNYFLNYNPIFILFKSFNFFKNSPYYIGFGFLWGYYSELIRKKPHIGDEEIRKYFWNKWNYGDIALHLKRKVFEKSKNKNET